MIVLDASVLIAYLDGTDEHHQAAVELLLGAIEEDLGANPLTLAEVLVVPARTGRLHAVLAILRDLDVRTLPFPADPAVRLAVLRASTSLRMPDCCVLLAAEEAGGRVASFDARLAQAAQARSLPVVHG